MRTVRTQRATAQAKEAQRAGIAHARANGELRAYRGRKPSYSRNQFESAQAMLGNSTSIAEVASAVAILGGLPVPIGAANE